MRKLIGVAVLLALSASSAPVAQPSARPKITTPKEEFGFNFGDDYFLANYKQIAGYWKKLDQESDRMRSSGHRQDRRGPHAAHGDRHVAGEPQEARALQGDLAPARARRGADRRRRRARWRRKARRSSGSTAACTPPRRSARSSSARWSTRWSAAPTTRRCAFLNDVHHPLRPRESGRQRPRRRLVHAQPGSEAAHRSTTCRGSTRSTSATTTTATSSRRRRRRRRT